MTRKLIGLVLVLGLAGAAWGQEKPQKVIKVMGSAAMLVMPDEAAITVNVQAEDAALAEARSQAATTLGRVVAGLKALPTEGLTLATGSLRVRTLVKPTQGRESYGGMGGVDTEVAAEVDGYRVTGSVRVRIHAEAKELAAKAAQVVDAAYTAGATTVEGPDFSRADTTEAQLQTLEAATRNAVAKAQALARGAGVEIAGYSYIGMLPTQDWDPEPVRRMTSVLSELSDGGGEGGPIEIGPVTISAGVWLEACCD